MNALIHHFALSADDRRSEETAVPINQRERGTEFVRVS